MADNSEFEVENEEIKELDEEYEEKEGEIPFSKKRKDAKNNNNNNQLKNNNQTKAGTNKNVRKVKLRSPCYSKLIGLIFFVFYQTEEFDSKNIFSKDNLFDNDSENDEKFFRAKPRSLQKIK